MKEICVYTCITGNYDNLHEIKNPEKNIDYYCFTNNKSLKSKTWKIIQIEDASLDNVRLARKIKILGHEKIANYNIAVWTDADVIWQKPISDFIKTYLKNTSLAIFKHHARNNIFSEATVCLRLRKDSKDTIIRTLNFYKSENFPDDSGLCESTVFIRKIHDPKIIETMKIWFDIVEKHSRRDQLSFNYAVWKTGLSFRYINLNVWNNNWFQTVKHIPKHEIKDCHVYFGDPDQNFDFSKYYIFPYQKSNDSYEFSLTVPCDTKEIEFAPANIIALDFRNIDILPKPKKISFFDTFFHNNNLVSCTDHSTFRIYGDFKTGQKLSISLKIDILENRNDIDKLIESQYLQNHQLLLTNSKLAAENGRLSTDLQNILNSRTWRAAQKLHRIISRVKPR